MKLFKLVLLSSFLIISGCSNYMYAEEINKSLELCKDRQGLRSVKTDTRTGRDTIWTSMIYATCNDGITLSVIVKGKY